VNTALSFDKNERMNITNSLTVGTQRTASSSIYASAHEIFTLDLLTPFIFTLREIRLQSLNSKEIAKNRSRKLRNMAFGMFSHSVAF